MLEYKTEIFSSMWDTKRSLKQKCDEILFKHANEGWELVNFQCTDMLGSMMMFVFKKEKK